jgi:hypothetical protein
MLELYESIEGKIMNERLAALKAQLRVVRAELDAHRRNSPHSSADRALTRADRALTLGLRSGNLMIATAELEALVAEISKPTFGFETPEMRAWLAADQLILDRERVLVDLHNAEVQRIRNDREIAKIRAAACPRCTMTHAGEC